MMSIHKISQFVVLSSLLLAGTSLKAMEAEADPYPYDSFFLQHRGKPKNLKSSIVSGPVLTDTVIQYLHTLQYLSLSSGEVSRLGLTDAANQGLPSLQCPSLKVTAAVFPHLTQLSELVLERCPHITGEDIAQLTTLKSLHLDDYTSPKGIEKLTNLTALSVMVDNTTDKEIWPLTNLKTLTLSAREYFSKGVRGLSTLSNLTRLSLRNMEMPLEYLNPSLTSLSLEDVHNTQELSSLTNLTDLQVKNCNGCVIRDVGSGFTDKTVQALPSLKSFSHHTIIRGGDGIKGSCFPYLTNLEVLNIDLHARLGYKHLLSCTTLKNLIVRADFENLQQMGEVDVPAYKQIILNCRDKWTVDNAHLVQLNNLLKSIKNIQEIKLNNLAPDKIVASLKPAPGKFVISNDEFDEFFTMDLFKRLNCGLSR